MLQGQRMQRGINVRCTSAWIRSSVKSLMADSAYICMWMTRKVFRYYGMSHVRLFYRAGKRDNIRC